MCKRGTRAGPVIEIHNPHHVVTRRRNGRIAGNLGGQLIWPWSRDEIERDITLFGIRVVRYRSGTHERYFSNIGRIGCVDNEAASVSELRPWPIDSGNARDRGSRSQCVVRIKEIRRLVYLKRLAIAVTRTIWIKTTSDDNSAIRQQQRG